MPPLRRLGWRHPALWPEVLLFLLFLLGIRLRLLLPGHFNRRWLAPAGAAPARSFAALPPRRAQRLETWRRLCAALARRLGRDLSCLRRSLALRARLRLAGLEAQLVYGLGRNAQGRPQAHAWVEHAGQRLDAADPAGRYQSFRPL